jgi:hypothetical protein
MSASTPKSGLPDRSKPPTRAQPPKKTPKEKKDSSEEEEDEEEEEESEEEEPTTWPTLSLSFPLPHTPRTLRAHVKVTRQSHCQLVFLASSSESVGAPPLGSFVYAIPNVCCPVLNLPLIPYREEMPLSYHHARHCIQTSTPWTLVLSWQKVWQSDLEYQHMLAVHFRLQMLA